MTAVSDTSFDCPWCSEAFPLQAWWVYHLERKHGVTPVLLDPTMANSSQVTGMVLNMSAPSTQPADSTNPAVHNDVRPKANFHVVYDLGQGNRVQQIRTIVPRDESYSKFLQRLQNVFFGNTFKRPLPQWEYVLVDRRYEKDDPLPLTTSNTYYAMVSELLRPKSCWRHTIVRRAVSLQ